VHALAGGHGDGHGAGRVHGCKALMEIHGADIKSQLGAQHLEKAVHVIGRLGQGVGHPVDALIFDLGQNAGPGIVPPRPHR